MSLLCIKSLIHISKCFDVQMFIFQIRQIFTKDRLPIKFVLEMWLLCEHGVDYNFSSLFQKLQYQQ